MNALEIRDLCKFYPGFSLDHLNLTLPSGSIMGLIGANGAGKSTVIKLILDMVRKDSGSITVLGQDHRDDPRLIREELGVVFDEVGVSECLTPRENAKPAYAITKAHYFKKGTSRMWHWEIDGR